MGSATEEQRRLLKNIESKEIEIQKLRESLKKVEDQYEWAQYLVIGGDLVINPAGQSLPSNARDLFYLKSKSGQTRGHYIERFKDRDGYYLDCNCPGFVNRGKCWASEEVAKSPLGLNWRQTRQDFDREKREAFKAQQR